MNKRIFEVGQEVEVDGKKAVIVSVHRISLIVRFTGSELTTTIRKSKVAA